MVAGLIAPFCIRPLRSWTGYWVALAMLYLVPALLQTYLWRGMGFIWQGRYTLPLVVVVFISVGLGLRRLRFPAGPRVAHISRVLFWLLVFCHTLTFAYVLRRYVVGISEVANWQSLFSSPDWHPPFGWLPLTLAYLLVTWFATLILFRYLHNGQPLMARASAGSGEDSGNSRVSTGAGKGMNSETERMPVPARGSTVAAQPEAAEVPERH
jgi:hypothetical protein